MFGIGTTEVLLILAVALLVIGPSKLPDVARALGKGLAEFRKMSSDVKKTIDFETQVAEMDKEEAEKKTKGKAEKEKDEYPEKAEQDEDQSKKYERQEAGLDDLETASTLQKEEAEAEMQANDLRAEEEREVEETEVFIRDRQTGSSAVGSNEQKKA